MPSDKKTTPEAEALKVTDQELKTIAASIGKVCDGLEQLGRAGLKRRTIALLINDLTGVPKSHVVKMLECGQALRDTYLARQ